MKWKQILAAASLALGFSLAASNASAALCSTTSASVAGSPGDVAEENFTLNSNAATDCGALYAGNDSEPLVQAIATELTWGTGYELAAKSDGDADDQEVQGVDWEVEVTGAGTWELQFSVDAGEDPISATFDLIVVGKQSTHWAAWFFDNVAISTDGSLPGTYVIEWCNGNTVNFDCSQTGISHLSLYVGERGGFEEVPEPGSLLLLGLGLAGLAFARRRRV